VAVSDVISFGPYRLIPAERLLLKEGEVVNVGNRALNILVALAETAGEVVRPDWQHGDAAIVARRTIRWLPPV
jgi:DNA-binding winged helix-turn-helix (wHTH) protein